MFMMYVYSCMIFVTVYDRRLQTQNQTHPLSFLKVGALSGILCEETHNARTHGVVDVVDKCDSDELYMCKV